MKIYAALAAVASLGLLTACEPDAADTGDEIANTAPTIDTTDSASEQLENEAEATREQAEKQAENVEERAEATAENIKESADKAAEKIEAEAEKAQ